MKLGKSILNMGCTGIKIQIHVTRYNTGSVKRSPLVLKFNISFNLRHIIMGIVVKCSGTHIVFVPCPQCMCTHMHT
jgi:hypothetical protein